MFKIGFKLKSALLVCSVLIALAGIGVGLGYRFTAASLRNMAITGLGKMAHLMAASITGKIDSEFSVMEANTRYVAVQDAVKVADSKYQNMNAGEIRQYLADIDKKWSEAGNEYALEYLENAAANRLKPETGENGDPALILVTDRYGGLVAATYRPGCFYQGDKDWWKKAFDGGKGAPAAGDILPEKSGDVWRMPLAVPVTDGSGEVTGVCMRLVDTGLVFKELAGFRIGATGTAALVDDKGYVVFQGGVNPYSYKFCGYAELQDLLSAKDGRLIMDNVYAHDGRVLAAFAKIDNVPFADKSMTWLVVVARDEAEVMSAMYFLFSKLLVVTLALVVIAFAGVFALGKGLLGPFNRFRGGIEHVKRGAYNYRVNLKTAYEIEPLAGSFNEMAEGLEESNAFLVRTVSRLCGAISAAGDAIRAMAGDMSGKLNVKQKNDLDTAGSNIALASGIADNLLDAARVKSGDLSLAPEPADMREILKKIIFVFEPKIREKGLDLKLDIPKGAINATFDANRIFQVFSCLLDNAMRFTEKGVITISVRQAKDGIQCRISDTGIGISKEALPKVFDSFQPSSRTPGGHDKGIGASLFISKAIIELHKGAIQIESRLGQGTTVSFIIR
ncbi:MAG: sensor histidine kinase [Candidatus Omnitrophota bacterium]